MHNILFIVILCTISPIGQCAHVYTVHTALVPMGVSCFLPLILCPVMWGKSNAEKAQMLFPLCVFSSLDKGEVTHKTKVSILGVLSAR